MALPRMLFAPKQYTFCLLLTTYCLLGARVASAEGPSAPAEAARPKSGLKLLANGLGQLQAGDAAAAFSLGLAYTSDWWNTSLVLRRGTEANKLMQRDEAGRFMLAPETAHTSLELSAMKCSRRWIGTGVGYGPYARLGIGIADWATINAESNEVTESSLAISGSLGAALRYDTNLNDNEVALTAGLGLTARMLGGNVGQEPTLRRALLGTEQRAFIGAELAIGLRLNGISIGASMPVLAGRVKGLTQGQLVIAVQLGGAVNLTPSSTASTATN